MASTDGSRDPEKRLPTIVTLEGLLQGTETRFREAVIEALIMDGFELHERHPYLHHPKEILDAIPQMEAFDSGEQWKAFRQDLLAAERVGTLVDLSLRETGYAPATPSTKWYFV
jgi:hypothetical protein